MVFEDYISCMFRVRKIALENYFCLITNRQAANKRYVSCQQWLSISYVGITGSRNWETETIRTDAHFTSKHELGSTRSAMNDEIISPRFKEELMGS